MGSIKGDNMSNLKENAKISKIETNEYKDYQFQTTYYNNSVAEFSALKKKTYFPVILISGIAFIAAQILTRGILSLSAWVRVFPILIALFIYYRRVRVRCQTILIFYDIGVQLETKFLFGRSCTFIEKSKILSSVIYDKMTYMELSPCIGLIVKDEKSLIIPFTDFKIPTEKNIFIYNALKMI